ncbi:hypothetical protein JCM10212_001761 [Sporobolomyces blumeae]
MPWLFPRTAYRMRDTTSRHGDKVSCYIETKEGKPFAVHVADLRTTSPPHSFIHQLYVDGSQQDHDLYSASLSSPSRISHFTGREASTTTVQPFLFGKLDTTDDDDEACEDEQKIKELGTIKVKRQERIAQLEREIAEATAGGDGEVGRGSAIKRIKDELDDETSALKKVKREQGTEMASSSSKSGKGKAKEQTVIVLSDTDD